MGLHSDTNPTHPMLFASDFQVRLEVGNTDKAGYIIVVPPAPAAPFAMSAHEAIQLTQLLGDAAMRVLYPLNKE